MGVFQKVNEWLAEKGDRIARGGDAGRTANNAYYASAEAQQVFGGASKTAQDAQAVGGDTARTAPADRFGGDTADKYGGRVPYKSQKDMQAEAESQRQQAEEMQRRQMTAQQQQKTQQFGRAPAQAAYAQQPQAQQGNVLPFPGMIRGPEGNYYAHVEYVVLLRSRNECTKVIEYIKANASVFLNMEFIANDSERQRCVDMLSGAAYTLGCTLSKISQRGIYLISSPSVYVVIDPAMQKFAAAPESQGYVRPEYANPANFGAAAQGYAAPVGNYAQPVMGARTAAYAQQGAYAAAQNPAAYAAQETERYATAPAAAYPAPTERFAAQNTAAYAAPGARTAPYAAQPAGNYSAPYPAQQTGAYAAQAAAPYSAQAAVGYGAGAQTGAFPPQREGYAAPGGMATPAAGTPQRRPGAPFGMQGAFVKSAEGGQTR